MRGRHYRFAERLRDNRLMEQRDPHTYVDSQLDELAAHLDVWKPGGYAGHLFAGFVRARDAVSEVNVADRPFFAERLSVLADRAGILVAPSENSTVPIAVIKVGASLREITAALSDVEPRVVVREEAVRVFTVWCNHVPPLAPAPAWLLGQIDASLRLFRHLGVFDNYILSPTAS